MATSESDDFESADEELNARPEHTNHRTKKYNSIGSDSDDDVDFIPNQFQTPIRKLSGEKQKTHDQKKLNSVGNADKNLTESMDQTENIETKETDGNSVKSNMKVEKENKNESTEKKDGEKVEKKYHNVEKKAEKTENKEKDISSKREKPQRQRKQKEGQSLGARKLGATKIDKLPEPPSTEEEVGPPPGVQACWELPDELERLKALEESGPPPGVQACWELPDELKRLEKLEGNGPPPGVQACWELPDELERLKALEESGSPAGVPACWGLPDESYRLEQLDKAKGKKKTGKGKNNEDPEEIPAELMSNLKFKDIFKPDGWEGISDDIELPDDLSDDKYHPVLDKLASVGTDQKGTNDDWGSWGSWGVSSLLNTATASVSTLTSHVSQGLSYLEETMGVPDPVDLVKSENAPDEEPQLNDKKSEETKYLVEDTPKEEPKEDVKETPSQFSSFGFGNFLSSVSSIQKLVETTSSKVISSGLDTLEVIGKKTMEVLQEGDPGLKKKRAFFMNEGNKPILSQILREAKEKAEVEEKSNEEKQLARKVHFESLFDDNQGLVHLEALEILSKQCIIKIQQQLVNLDGSELTSMQETLDEVKELCELGDEDDDEDKEQRELKQKLEEALKDLGVTISYDKIVDVWNKMNSEISSPESKDIGHREMYQMAISALAQFTAYSVERFHKTAELLLIKPRRSTVNEADSLVQLTMTLSSQIGSVANLYCNKLNEFENESDKSEVKSSITTITLEATNASSYVQEAFRLLIPILQVGAI